MEELAHSINSILISVSIKEINILAGCVEGPALDTISKFEEEVIDSSSLASLVRSCWISLSFSLSLAFICMLPSCFAFSSLLARMHALRREDEAKRASRELFPFSSTPDDFDSFRIRTTFAS